MSGPMKTKHLIFILSCFVATSIFIYLFSGQQPTLHTLVSEKLANLKNLKDNLQASERKELTTDEKYLKILGFLAVPRLYPKDVWHNVTLPVIVTAVDSGQADDAIRFVSSTRHYLPDRTIVVYDLGLSEYEISLINHVCNSSTCFMRKFNYENFPAHVSDSIIKAYRPLIIQELLSQAGAVLWMDVNSRLVSAGVSKLDGLLQQAANVGLVAWSINQPTSALTHPRMFEYFHAQQQNFYFHHMVEPSHLLLYNTADVHRQLMLPWVQCALTFECVAPIGAQSSGCRFDKKPMYRYSGCHRYDASAFNVALGVMFGFNDAKYTTREKVFRLLESVGQQSQQGGADNETTVSEGGTGAHEEYVP